MESAAQLRLREDGIGELLRQASIEISPRDAAAAAKLGEWFAPGTQVFINFLPGSDHAPTISQAAALRRAGFEPVPHVTARGLVGRDELSEVLVALRAEADVTRILAIAGDIAVPRGPFASTLDLIATGLLAEHGIREVGISGYPEGHHTLSAESIARHSAEKRRALRQQGLAAFITTQFCFEAAPILDWLRALRGEDPQVPVRIGIAGPASLRSLLTFAMKCGVGNSLRVLLNQPQSIGRMLRDASPDELVEELAAGLSALPPAEQPSLHLFPFGGLAKTAAWRARRVA